MEACSAAGIPGGRRMAPRDPRAPEARMARALVLGGGGAHAAYQVGVLSAIVGRVPDLEFPILTGVSAGAINIAYLAAYHGPLAAAVAALRDAVRTRLPLDHVMAAAAIPILFPAVRLHDQFYGDGSVRHTAPFAPAIHLGARALLVITTLPSPGPTPVALPRHAREYPSVAEVMALLLHAAFVDGPDADAERLERINRLLDSCAAGGPAPDGLEPVRLLVLRPSRELGGLVTPHRARPPP